MLYTRSWESQWFRLLCDWYVPPYVRGPGFVPAFQVTFKFNVFFFPILWQSFSSRHRCHFTHIRHKSLYLDESDRLGYLSLPCPKLLTFFPRDFSRVESRVFNLGASDIGPVLRYSLGFFYPINGDSHLWCEVRIPWRGILPQSPRA